MKNMFFGKKDQEDLDLEEIERDIRTHEFADDDFAINFTDSTCPFTHIMEQIKEPGMQYLFAHNDPDSIAKAMRRKWVLVDKSRLTNKSDFEDQRSVYSKEGITAGDTILMERDERYGKSETRHYQDAGVDLVRSSLQPMNKVNIRDLRKPFSN